MRASAIGASSHCSILAGVVSITGLALSWIGRTMRIVISAFVEIAHGAMLQQHHPETL